ncbi:MAG: hypothetical protein ACLFWL_10335 [Candidatus Brocadiia bacterium]
MGQRNGKRLTAKRWQATAIRKTAEVSDDCGNGKHRTANERALKDSEAIVAPYRECRGPKRRIEEGRYQ